MNHQFDPRGQDTQKKPEPVDPTVLFDAGKVAGPARPRVCCLTDFQPQEVLFEALSRDRAHALLRGVFSGVDEALFVELLNDISLIDPEGLCAVLRRAPTNSDVSLADYT